jgi:hypothetical protein
LWIRIRIEEKCGIRIRIESIRIHNPDKNKIDSMLHRVWELLSDYSYGVFPGRVEKLYGHQYR